MIVLNRCQDTHKQCYRPIGAAANPMACVSFGKQGFPSMHESLRLVESCVQACCG